MPLIARTPRMIAMIGAPGMPKVSIGTIAPSQTGLLALS